MTNIIITHAALISAVILDTLFPDPESRFHPVRITGRLINRMETLFFDMNYTGTFAGFIFTITSLTACMLPAWFITEIASHNHISKFIFETGLFYFSVALGSLFKEGHGIYKLLSENMVVDAQNRVSRICGRDTQKLNKYGVIRATVESMAENTVDGFTGPVFYGIMFGPLGAWGYRIANTLDSMVGYKNEKYFFFGKVSARLDDILNYIPSRLTACCIAMVSAFGYAKTLPVLRTFIAEGKSSDSPNAGLPIAAVAGALEVQLGGPSDYSGVHHNKPFICKENRNVEKEDICDAITICKRASFLYLIIFVCIYSVIAGH